MATSALTLGSTKDVTLRLKYSAYRFRPYMRELEAACLAHPHANLVLTGKDPITKFLRRNRRIKRIIPLDKRPTKEEIFNNPRKACGKFVETLEAILDKAMTTDTGESEDEEDSIENPEEKSEEQLAAEKAAATEAKR